MVSATTARVINPLTLRLATGDYSINPPVVLAPMAGITNAPFRTLCRELGAGLFVSEMVTARALIERRPETLQDIVEQIVTGFGLELVDIERSAGGLLRVTIDLPWNPQAAVPELVTVEDCEKVTRQLQFTLEVEASDYRRLEVSSPGIDRPMRTQQDFERFTGQVIDVTLKAPMGEQAAGQVRANRKKFRGTLERWWMRRAWRAGKSSGATRRR